VSLSSAYIPVFVRDTAEMIEPIHVTATSTGVSPIPTVIAPEVYYEAAGATGQRTLWVVCVLMGLTSLAFYTMAFRVPVQKRLFHVLTGFITTFAFISYFAMASGDGISWSTVILTQKHKHDIPDTHKTVHREIYWARYIDWSLTTPLLLLDLSFLAGLNGASILVAVVADLVMCLTGLMAAFSSQSSNQWGYYTIACLAYLTIVYQLAIQGRATVRTKDNKTATFYTAIASFTLILWTAYPIIWGIADGSRNISVDAEIVCYAVLDVLAKAVFGFWLLFTHDAMASSSFSLEGFWSNGLSKDGAIRVGDDDEGA